jgi:hypothetical protein
MKQYPRRPLLALALLVTGCQSTANDANAPQPSLTRPPISAPPPPRHAGPVRHPWLPAAPHRQWKYIVLHHSDTVRGSAASFDKYHRQHNGWHSLGYHFVIGNGDGAGNGQIEPGPRWVRQETGAHAGVLEYNERGIGVCLVGNFQSTRPTPHQLESTARLVAYLMKTYRIPASNVIGHNAAKNGRTSCPGRYFSVAQVRGMATRIAAGEDVKFTADTALAQGELLFDH